MLQKVLWSVAAVGCLVIAFVVGTGSVATATQGSAVIAGQGNTETNGAALCNAAGTCFTSSVNALNVTTDHNGGAGLVAEGNATNGYGVYGEADGTGGEGVLGTGVANGVHGLSSSAGSTGVLGEGITYGVHGRTLSNGGWGVWGEGDDRGVYGSSNNEGVVGFGTNVGVRADSPGIALRVTGKVELSRSGLATVAGTAATPKASVVVTGVALSAKSMVIATVQTSAGVWVKAAVPNVAGSSMTIYLNKAVSKSVPVAWMVIEQP